MKRNRALDVTTYTFQPGERVLVDANIWIYLQPPISKPGPGYSWKYSTALKNLLKAKATPIIETLVLSEYLNRYLRIEYQAGWLAHYKEYKEFRSSSDFATVAAAAIGDARKILQIASPVDTPLSSTDLTCILVETEAGTIDFNDGVLLETCRLRGWKILTNDSDMKLGGIEVLTANPKLLAACP